ncbi:unnamed protein product [Leptosia nina]|uniref:Uncharacterized protein n=1 Tax=Leptosia nina TaxID=320188 RepID=A0AAV1J0H8_9NEOP
MDRIPAPLSLPQILQVFQPTVSMQPSLLNQDTAPSDSGHSLQNSSLSCQPIQSRTAQIQTENQSITSSHVFIPVQHVLSGSVAQQYFRGYNTFMKNEPCSNKCEPRVTVIIEHNVGIPSDSNELKRKREKSTISRIRRYIPDPTQWKSNIRKQKCQRGEAYINRRGKLVPEKHIRNTKDCLTSCRHKCMEKITYEDRQLIFKSFYSLDANEKKHFLLNTTERHLYKNKEKPSDGKRNYSFKYFFLVRATRFVVCKNFYLGTLAISQKPVYNVHLNKTDVNLPKRDGRGLSPSSCHALPNEAKDRVRMHIMSFQTVDSKAVTPFSAKRQYLNQSLNIKQMHLMYVKECEQIGETPLKESMYRKIVKQEFNLRFKSVKTCGKCKEPVSDK